MKNEFTDNQTKLIEELIQMVKDAILKIEDLNKIIKNQQEIIEYLNKQTIIVQ